MNTNIPRFGARSFLGIAAATACLALSDHARADDHMIAVSQTVNAVGIDLGTPEGARRLYDGLKEAARNVCTDGVRLGLVPEPVPWVCYENSLGNAVRSVNRPQLTIIYLRTHSLQSAEAYGIRVPALVASK